MARYVSLAAIDFSLENPMKTHNQIVSLIAGFLVCYLPTFAGEEQKPSTDDNKPQVADPAIGGTPLLIGDVFKRRDELLGKKVKIVASLLTHFEGPWICLHPDAPFENSISLKLPEGCVLTAKDGARKLDWLENDQGYPAVISGTLRMREKRSPDDPEVKLYVDVTSGRELAVDDPLWRKYIQQFKHEAGTDQPAIRSESKQDGNDKPEPASEESSRQRMRTPSVIHENEISIT